MACIAEKPDRKVAPGRSYSLVGGAIIQLMAVGLQELLSIRLQAMVVVFAAVLSGCGDGSRIGKAGLRPENGVRHPVLDEAWAKYDGFVATAAASIRPVIFEQFNDATAKGDLDAAEQWQAALEKLETGELDGVRVRHEALADYEKAKNELREAYKLVIKSLTIEKRIAEAKLAREELVYLFPPTLPVSREPSTVTIPEFTQEQLQQIAEQQNRRNNPQPKPLFDSLLNGERSTILSQAKDANLDGIADVYAECIRLLEEKNNEI